MIWRDIVSIIVPLQKFVMFQLPMKLLLIFSSFISIFNIPSQLDLIYMPQSLSKKKNKPPPIQQSLSIIILSSFQIFEKFAKIYLSSLSLFFIPFQWTWLLLLHQNKI